MTCHKKSLGLAAGLTLDLLNIIIHTQWFYIVKLNIFSISLGCPKNRVDTEHLLGSIGPLTITKDLKSAQAVLINTCGFIQPAVQESVQTILDVAQDIKKIPKPKRPLFAVAGCLPGRYGLAPLREELPEVDLWLTLDNKDKWPELLKAALQLRFANNFANLDTTPGRFLSTSPSFAYLKISEGCEHKCSFCTIPAIRGPLRSIPQNILVTEAANLIQSGVKELVLVAQDLTAYGHDVGDKEALPRLLDKLGEIPDLARIRLMYLYPSGLNQEFLHFLQHSDAPLLPYFDVPVQHSHPDILTRMGRPFAKNAHKTLDLIRDIFPDSAIRTSLITGFPGEEEKHFEHLLEFVQKVRFDSLGVFAYQPEEGTVAASMPGQIDETVKLSRQNIIMQTQAEISEELLARHVGKNLDILIDEPQGEWPGLFVGRTWFQAPEVDGITYISGPSLKSGSIVQAEITESHEYDLTALA